MSDLGEYKVVALPDGSWGVVFERVQRVSIAAFFVKDRAEQYAEVENIMLHDDPTNSHDDVKLLPAQEAPPPKAKEAVDALQRVMAYCREPASAEKNGRNLRADKPQRRFTEHAPLDPGAVNGLAANHPAALEGRTLFPTTVVDPKDSPRLLVSGANQRKIGDRVTKGPWAGMPIYTLTLEERATCPATCHHWLTCYGNGMPQARRHKHGPDFEDRLELELGGKQARHPSGFVVRLHVLGDFYSPGYVEKWAAWLDQFPALRAFGYTAHEPDSAIGRLIVNMTHQRWDRFAIRWSSEEGGRQGATTIWRIAEGRQPEGIVCPAQTHPDVCCGSCGLCWAPSMKEESIAFIAHGRLGKAPMQPSVAKPGRPPVTDAEARKRAIWEAAAQSWNDVGRGPSLAEIAKATGIPTGSIFHYLQKLSVENKVRRTGGGLEVLVWPEGMVPPKPVSRETPALVVARPESTNLKGVLDGYSAHKAKSRAERLAEIVPVEPDRENVLEEITRQDASAAFDKPVKRRCESCHGVFDCRRVGEVRCGDCSAPRRALAEKERAHAR